MYGRLLQPSSKKKVFENRNLFFDKMDFSLDDVYRALTFFNKHKDEMLLSLHKRIRTLYGRDTSLVYYDVTNYYFEIDKQTLIPMIRKIRKDYELGRIIIVGDKGMMAGDNIRQILVDKNGYVLSYSIRGANAAFKEYVLEEDGYRIGSDLETRPVYVSSKDHIEAHFLTCFVSLVLARLLEKKMDRKYSVTAILESLNKCSCSLLEQNLYLFDYYDEILRAIGKELDIDFSRKYRTVQEIKKIIGESKKTDK